MGINHSVHSASGLIQRKRDRTVHDQHLTTSAVPTSHQRALPHRHPHRPVCNGNCTDQWFPAVDATPAATQPRFGNPVYSGAPHGSPFRAGPDALPQTKTVLTTAPGRAAKSHRLRRVLVGRP